MGKMLDYLVTTFEGCYDIKEMEKRREELEKQHGTIKMIEVESTYFNEKAIVFCTEQIEKNLVLEWFEKEQEKFYQLEDSDIW